jgi:hypothetical protein
MLELAQNLSCKSGQDAVQLFFPLMFTLREKLSQVPPIPEDNNVTPPLPKNAPPPCVATVYNKLTGGRGVGVSLSEHPVYLAPALACFVFCLLSFLHLLSPPVRFLEQTLEGRKR